MYYIGRGLCKIFLRLMGGYTSIGEENIPKTGGVIIAPNHISYADPPLVGAGMRRPIHFMAKEELFKVPVLGMFIRYAGCFPVKRGKADRQALKRAIGMLEQGKVICIFPEGTRSPDGKLQDPELGLGLVALKSRAPVIPTAVIGTDRVLPAHSKRPGRFRTKIVYGEPLIFPDLYDIRDSKQAIEEACRRTMTAIEELLSCNSS